MNKMTRFNSLIITDVLNKGEYASLALSDGNDPYILNLHYGFDSDSGNLYFITDKKGLKLDVLKSNSYVCGSIVIKNPAEHRSGEKYSSVVFRGVIEVIHGAQEQALALSCLESQPGYCPDRKYTEDSMYMKLEMEEIDGRVYP